MDVRTQRTLLRVGVMLVVLVIAILVLVLVPSIPPQLSTVVYGLLAAAGLGLEQWIKNSGDSAAPTVAGVNLAIEESSAVVPPPKVAIPSRPPIVTTK
jgi:uncharacterized membrane protein YccC